MNIYIHWFEKYLPLLTQHILLKSVNIAACSPDKKFKLFNIDIYYLMNMFSYIFSDNSSTGTVIG